MIDLVAVLAGIGLGGIFLLVLKVRADGHDRARAWIEDAEAIGLAHRVSAIADVGSEAAGKRGRREVIVRGARDQNEAPHVRVLVGFEAPIPLGMELLTPPTQQPISVYTGQSKLKGARGWSLRAVEKGPAKKLLRRVGVDLDDARRSNDAVRVHDGGVILEREGSLSRSALTEVLAEAEAIATAIERAWAAIEAEPPAQPVSWPDLARRHELDVDPEARLIRGRLRGAFIEARLSYSGTEIRVEVGEGTLAKWFFTREGGLEVDDEETPPGVERALRELPAGVHEVEVVERWIEAHCDRLDAAALGAALHRVLDARDVLLGTGDVYR